MDNNQLTRSPKGRGVVVEQVTYAGQESTSIRELAPAASFDDHPTMPDSTSSSNAPMDVESNPLVPPSNSNIMSNDTHSNDNNDNVKVCTHIEKNTSPTATPGQSATQLLSECVENIVNAAESREASARESSLANGEGATGGGQMFEAAALYGGPFTMLELEQLSLHCTSSSSSSSTSTSTSSNIYSSSRSNNKTNLGAWSTIDGDVLSTLTPMLQVHVTSALGIDLVGEGRSVIAQSMENAGDGLQQKNKNKEGGNNGRRSPSRPVITIHQVSILFFIINALYYYVFSLTFIDSYLCLHPPMQIPFFLVCIINISAPLPYKSGKT